MGFFGGSQPMRPASRRPAPKTTPSPAFNAECDKAMAELQLRTGAHVGAWHMDECDWTVDQGTGQITFTDKKRGIAATAPVQIIGTYNTEDSTWLWAWSPAPGTSTGQPDCSVRTRTRIYTSLVMRPDWCAGMLL